jgi:hypothetical protein
MSPKSFPANALVAKSERDTMTRAMERMGGLPRLGLGGGGANEG